MEQFDANFVETWLNSFIHTHGWEITVQEHPTLMSHILRNCKAWSPWVLIRIPPKQLSHDIQRASYYVV